MASISSSFYNHVIQMTLDDPCAALFPPELEFLIFLLSHYCFKISQVQIFFLAFIKRMVMSELQLLLTFSTSCRQPSSIFCTNQ